MKLELIHNGSNNRRQVPISELLNNFVFGGLNPRRFVSGETYAAGDYVYEVSQSGQSIVYLCINSGSYERIDTTNWLPASVTSMISQQLDMRLGDLWKSSTRVDFTYDTCVTGDLEISNGRIKLPDTCTEYSQLILFLNGTYVSSDLGDYMITLKSHMKYIETTWDFDDYLLYVMTPKNHAARLIRTSDMNPTSASVTDGILSIYIPRELQINSYALNVYVDGLYISPKNYYVNYDETTDMIEIRFNRKSDLPTDIKRYVISVLSSRSPDITINETSMVLPIQTTMNRYRIDNLSNSEKIYDCPLVFCGGKALPSNNFTIQNNAMSVMSSDYYGEIGETYAITSYQFTIASDPSIYTFGSIVVDADEKRIAIPIIGYDESMDILLFRKAGTLINKNRYYIHDGSVSLYDHDDSIHEGDLLSVRVLNSDPTVSSCSMITTVRADRTIAIPEELENSQFLMFSTDGRYIGKHLYNTTTGLISLINECELNYGDTVEIVYNNYTDGYTRTVTKVTSSIVTTENKFILPVKVYSPDDNFIIFNATTGYAIQPSNYQISATGIVTITDGTSVEVGDSVDVYVSRELRTYVYSDAINRVVENI